MLYPSPYSRRGFLQGSILGVAAAVGCSRESTRRPNFSISTSGKFDAGSVPAYRGDHSRIYSHVEQRLDQHLEKIRRWVRQPSISAQNIGIKEMAELLKGDLETLGFQETELVPTDRHPGVWGYYDAGAPKTLMLYLMYDVQPVNPDDWESPPFEGGLVETDLGRVLMARGATNQKGPERAFLNALESIIAVEGKPPVNIMVAAEGEEELGSPHYPQIIDKYEARLRNCDGAFFPFNSQTPSGDIELDLGVKGILYLEMEAQGGVHGGPAKAEIHGSFKALVDSPVIRLVQALASLTERDGNTIAVPGYYSSVRAPTAEERRLINALLDSWDEESLRHSLSVGQWIDGMTGEKALMSYLYHPTLNIDGIWGGYTGEGVKTILPHKATAKVDSRLPPDLGPEEALKMIRRHLDTNGFGDIQIRKLSGYPSAQTSVEAGLVQAAIGVFNKYGHTPAVWPRLAGSAPLYQFTERLKLPLVFAGLGHGSGAHAPNEYMVISPREGSKLAGLAEIEKGYVDLLYALAEA